VEEASEPVDEVVTAPIPRKEEVAQDRPVQADSNATAASIHALPADNNQPIEQTNPPETEADEVAPIVQKETPLSEHGSKDTPERHDQPLPAAPIVQAAEPEPSTSAPARNLDEHHKNVVQVQKDVTKPFVVKKTAQLPEAARKTILEETIELDREINDLRSQLSAKLLKQNRELRRMLERYNNK
jgi:hypothetical protein